MWKVFLFIADKKQGGEKAFTVRSVVVAQFELTLFIECHMGTLMKANEENGPYNVFSHDVDILLKGLIEVECFHPRSFH